MESALERKTIGKYDVLEVLGRGGMGVVYKAMDSRIRRLVAIKMMTGEVSKDPDYLKRFYREAQSTGILQHPNIVVVYDLGDEYGNPYLVMEYLEGIALDKVIAARTNLSIYEKLNILIQVLDGLAYAHQRGIVHRDIKPQNIMVLRDRTVKIVDFGIARMGNTGLTKTGQVIGTINYMSPEQINAQAVDGRSDIFSAAVVLYELLTYALPFEGRDTTSTIMKILQDAVPPLKEKLGASYPPELDQVLGHALAKERDERFQTASDFALELTHVRDRLKRDMIHDCLERGRAAMERGELGNARELLQQVVKIDPQHGLGKEMLQQVQEKLLRQEREGQLRQLQADAEDAFNRQLYDDALLLVEQALSLEKSNLGLQKLRSQIQEAKFKKERYAASLRRAASAQQAGNFEDAQRAVEEALAIDPGGSQAKLLKATVLKRIDQQARARQLAELLENARMNIQSRRYTVASDLLKQAEKIDPESLEVQVLLQETQQAHQEEANRRQLEMLTHQVEEALATEDHETAWNKSTEALVLAPGDTHMLELRRQAEGLRVNAEKKRATEQAVEEARRLLKAGESAGALSVLEAALRQFPADTRLNTLLATVRQTVEKEGKEKLKRDFLAKAKVALEQRDYAAAIEALKQAQAALPGALEIEQLLRFAQQEFSREGRTQPLESVPQQAQRLCAEGNFDQAIALLESALRTAPDEQLRALLADIRRKSEEFRREMGKLLGRAQQMAAAGKAAEAVALLEANAATFGRHQDFQEVLADIKQAADQQKSAVGKPQQRPGPTVGDAIPARNSVASTMASPAGELPLASQTPVVPPTAPPSATAAQASPAAAAPQAAPATQKAVPPQVSPLVLPKKGGGKGILIAVLLVILFALAGGTAFFLKGRLGHRAAAPGADTAYIEVFAVPWGTVKSVASTDGSVLRSVNQQTPVRVNVPPGEYTIVVFGPDGSEQTETVQVTNDKPGRYQPVFGKIDVQQIINNSK
jgi:tetratricopeptide (TPR) repeat protein/predicted Ser/Thr protein kinase